MNKDNKIIFVYLLNDIIDQYCPKTIREHCNSVLYEQGALQSSAIMNSNLHNFFEQSLVKSAKDVPPNTNLLAANKVRRNMMQVSPPYQ